MCGIVGYLGPREPKEVIIKGLKSLEYRGYDSAGVAILDRGHFKRVRSQGKLANLENKLLNEKFDGHLGIGHTRWATHGKPSERNAHPHNVGGVSIVHNGIIENYTELKEELAKKGAVFESETDSELVAHLLHSEIGRTKDLLLAVQAVLPRLRGAYSIVAVWESQSDVMVAFKNGPPLVLGIGEGAATDFEANGPEARGAEANRPWARGAEANVNGPEARGCEMFLASDIQAIMPYTRRVIFLEDQEIAWVKGGRYCLINRLGQELVREPILMEWSPQQAQKGGYKYFMLKEIFEQPRAVANALSTVIDIESRTVRFPDFSADDMKAIEGVRIVACGTSYYAGMVGKYAIEKWGRLPVEIDIASEFRYRDPILSSKILTIVISQSGETADTLAALRLVRENGGRVVSICNVKNSSIDRESDRHVYMNAGAEIGVASTKAFTATLALVQALALMMGKARGQLPREVEIREVTALLSAPSHMETVLAFDKYFAEAAKYLKTMKGFLYMGRGAHYPIALEGALKMKELAYKHAEGYAAGEMKHGPLALIDPQMMILMLAPSDELFEKTLSNLEEAKARGGKIMALGTGDNKKLRLVSDHYLALPEAPQSLLPLIEVIPLQLLAYHVAHSLGHDVDQPRNLAKSVTVE